MISSIASKAASYFKKFLIKFVATFAFSGCIPFASGTFGSLAAIAVLYPMIDNTSVAQKGYMIYILFVFGYIATHLYIKEVKKSDPRSVVIDEAIGILLTVTINQYLLETVLKNIKITTLVLSAVSFVLFRIFDIFKPFPIKRIEKKFRGAFGVIFDDVIAAVFASLTLWLILHFFAYKFQ